MERVYLDTSFFIELLDRNGERLTEARKIVAYEKDNDRFTSILTLNEFLIRIYDYHKHYPDCDEHLKAAELQIRSIARVEALSDEIVREAALVQSIYGESQGQATPPQPRDRKFRWDAIHIATACLRRCSRIYAWDGKWNELPDGIKSRLGEVIAPALCPGLPFQGPQPPAIEEAILAAPPVAMPAEVTGHSPVTAEGDAAEGVGKTAAEGEVTGASASLELAGKEKAESQVGAKEEVQEVRPDTEPGAAVATGAVATEQPPPSEPPPAAAPASDSPPEPSRP